MNSGQLHATVSSSALCPPGPCEIIVDNPSPGGGLSNGYSLLTIGLPTVAGPTSASVAGTTATLGGSVASDGGSAITERGVVYSLTSANPDPAIGGAGVTAVTAPGTTGVFAAGLTGLNPGTGYSFKAYATNSAGTGYSPDGNFVTSAASLGPSLVSVSGRRLMVQRRRTD